MPVYMADAVSVETQNFASVLSVATPFLVESRHVVQFNSSIVNLKS